MKKSMIMTSVLALTAALFLGACTDTAPDGPVPGLGSNSVTKYVAIGNSLSAGYQSNGLYESAQMYSFPNLIAGQLIKAGSSLGTFEQPLWSDPGSYDAGLVNAARYEIISLVGPVIGPKGLPAGSQIKLTTPRAYDNLGIPASVIGDFLDTTNFMSKTIARKNPFFAHVLRSSSFGANVLAQAKSLSPNLISFWLGNNDVLGFATSGGTSPSAPTPLALFNTYYGAAMDQLKAALPNTKVFVATIPDVKAIPFFTTVGPKMAASIPAVYWLRYQKHGNVGLAYDSTKLTEAGAPLICLTGSSYASLLGQQTGAWYRYMAQALGYPLSAIMAGAAAAGIDTTRPFGFHPQNPWPDALCLDASEQATAQTATLDFNNSIASLAAQKGYFVVDMYSFFNTIKASGFLASGVLYKTDYVSGGLFSLDGVHPSSRGAGIVANEFIRVMNEKLGMTIPTININGLPGLPAPLAKFADEAAFAPVIPFNALSSYEMLWSGK